jgi:hypothetical protein
LADEDPDEFRIRKAIEQVDASKTEFVERTERWLKNLPDHFREFDFDSMAGNLSQFKSIEFLGQMDEVCRSIFDSLDKVDRGTGPARLVSYHEKLPSGQEMATDDERQKRLLDRIEEFERKTGRLLTHPSHLYRNDKSQYYLNSFKGLNISDGIGYLEDVGRFYFDLRKEMLEMELAAVERAKSTPRATGPSSTWDVRFDDDQSDYSGDDHEEIDEGDYSGHDD